MRNRMVALSNFSFAVGETRIAISFDSLEHREMLQTPAIHP